MAEQLGGFVQPSTFSEGGALGKLGAVSSFINNLNAYEFQLHRE